MREQPVRYGWQWAIIILVALYAAVLLFAPLVAIITRAFENGLQPVIDALTAADAISALKLSFSLAITAALINVVIGVTIAWVLVRHDFPGKWLFNALVDLPFVISPVIVGSVMILLFGREGWFKDFPIPLAFSLPGMLVVTTFVSLPFVIREVMPSLAALTSEQEEAARTLGASRWRIAYRLIFPGIRHGMIYGIVLTLARALGEFGAVAVIGGGVQGVTETATIYVFRSLHDRNNVGAYGMAILLALISIGILVIMNWLRASAERRGSNHVHRA
ncbi:MAG TPA: sulfate ABC transporter permease subunit [Phototrophicaceae bacterium]|jgi:sulfate transport system permease protein|nr:sulfate ABC transporter permease subunit [Phototrophicaceae bacterium]